MPKVSVIVLIYNVESYIQRCVESLFSQSLDDVEFIFVNDATPDNSMIKLNAIVKSYPKYKNNIKIINHEVNQGAAASRRDGIAAATGEYIIHLDSDDYSLPDTFERLYQKAKEIDADIVIGNIVHIDDNNQITGEDKFPTTDKDKIISGIVNRSLSPSLCNKLVKGNICHNPEIIFPKAHMMEDLVLFLQYVYHSRNISTCPDAKYYYQSNSNSICHRQSENDCITKWRQSIINIDITIDFLSSVNLIFKLRDEIVRLKNSARVFIWPLVISSPHKYLRLWANTYPEINKVYWRTSNIDVRLKIIFYLTLGGIYPYFKTLINMFKQ